MILHSKKLLAVNEDTNKSEGTDKIEDSDKMKRNMASSFSLLEKVGVTKFDGKNYKNWRFRLQMALEAEDENVVEILKNIDDTTTVKDFNKRNRICKLLITGALADSHLVYAKEVSHVYEILNRLDRVYREKGTASRVSLKGE